MSKERMYGMKTGYTPNSKDDMRYRKKVYQRGREASLKEQKERSKDKDAIQKGEMPI